MFFLSLHLAPGLKRCHPKNSARQTKTSKPAYLKSTIRTPQRGTGTTTKTEVISPQFHVPRPPSSPSTRTATSLTWAENEMTGTSEDVTVRRQFPDRGT